MEILTQDNYKEYEEFLQKNPKGHFMQSVLWKDVKDNWIYKVIAVRDDDGNLKGTMAVLIRNIPMFKNTIMYSPRGPVCDIYDKDTIRRLIDGAKVLAKEHKSYVLKIDPDVKSADEKFSGIMRELGFKFQSASKNFEGIQPRFVFRLDIEGKTEEEVMMTFESKTRYNIRVAEKRGVSVHLGSRAELSDFHKIMEETGIRDQFIIRNLGYFEKMYDALGENIRLYMATFEDKPIAGTLAICYGDKVWYLYGASSNEYRNVMPNYLLQWEMIKWAIEKKCRIYDFRGVSGDLDESNPLYGLYRFKKGFNGEFTEFIGELDYIFNKPIYFAVEKGEKAFRELRRRIMLMGKK